MTVDLRNVSRWALSACFAALVSFCQAVVANSSFETGSGTMATGWTAFGNAFRDASYPRGGDYNLKLYGGFTGGTNVSGAYQNVPLVPGQSIEASTWAIHRTGDALAGDNYALLKVIYRNAAGTDLLSQESKRITAATTKDQFQLISASLDRAPLGTTHAAVFLLFVQPASTPFAAGAALFDDLDVRVLASTPRKLVFQDEFDGTSLNLSRWEPMIGDGSAYGIPGWGNNELQYYTDRPANLLVQSGLLKIIARRENFGGRAYTSARLRTKGKADFLYGRIEARIFVPAGRGLWPAFWMLASTTRYGGWASSGEIDIFETVNSANRSYHTIHYGAPSPNNVSSGANVALTPGFHTFALEWRPDFLRWYVDGSLVYSRKSLDWYSSAAFWNQRAPFDAPFHLLLNLAVGGNWPGNPDGTTPFPAEMQVDWVRVYRDVTRAGSASG